MRYQGLAFLGVIVIVATLGTAFTGNYPAAIAVMPESAGGGTAVIWAKDADRMGHAAIAYYRQMQSSASSTVPVPPGAEREAFSKSVSVLVDRAFVSAGIDAAGLRPEADALFVEKMSVYGQQPEFSAAIAMMYGLSPASFVEFIARPETEKEILMEKKGWDDAAFAAWVEELKQQGRIVRFVK